MNTVQHLYYKSRICMLDKPTLCQILSGIWTSPCYKADQPWAPLGTVQFWLSLITVTSAQQLILLIEDTNRKFETTTKK